MKLEKVNMTPGEKAMALEAGEVFYTPDGSLKFYRHKSSFLFIEADNVSPSKTPNWPIVNWGDQWYRKAKTFECNGFELIDDRYEPGDVTSSVFIAQPLDNDWYGIRRTHDTVVRHIERGIVHRAREGAIAHAKAMCGIDPNSGEQ